MKLFLTLFGLIVANPFAQKAPGPFCGCIRDLAQEAEKCQAIEDQSDREMCDLRAMVGMIRCVAACVSLKSQDDGLTSIFANALLAEPKNKAPGPFCGCIRDLAQEAEKCQAIEDQSDREMCDLRAMVGMIRCVAACVSLKSQDDGLTSIFANALLAEPTSLVGPEPACGCFRQLAVDMAKCEAIEDDTERARCEIKALGDVFRCVIPCLTP